MKILGLALAAAAIVVAACSSATTGTAATTPSTVPVEQTSTDTDAGTTTTTSDGDRVAASVDLEPTPAQQQGPYYPTEKPEDRDNDLTAVTGAGETPVGTVLLLSGRLLTTDGLPVGGAVIEIWQTDANGIYQHPDDPKTTDRDPHFQFYGESLTKADGTWSFRTIDPGYYEPRPRHIHVKVRHNGDELLTTQIYFDGDERLAGHSIDEGLIARIAATEEKGITVLTGRHDLVVDL